MKNNIYEQNRKAWNEAMKYHKKGRKYSLVDLIKKDKILDSVEKKILQSLKLENENICQLCCNNGRELVAIKRKYNTNRTVGFDLSDEAIKEAKYLNKYFQLNIDFIRCNIFDIDDSFFNNFKYIYITVGTLNWIKDLECFFKLVYNLLESDGVLIIYELHPITKIFPALNSTEYLNNDNKKISYDYFDITEDKYYNGLDYIGGNQYDSVEIVEYNHTLSYIINSIIKSGLKITEFEEYKSDISSMYEHLEDIGKLPLSYTIIAKK